MFKEFDVPVTIRVSTNSDCPTDAEVILCDFLESKARRPYSSLVDWSVGKAREVKDESEA